MKIEFENDKFILSDIDYELMQTILHGIDSERKRMNDKISNLSSLIYKNYSEEQKEDFKIQLAYIRDKQKYLNKIIKDCDSKIENKPI